MGTELELAGRAEHLKAGLKALAAAAVCAVRREPRGARVLLYHSVTSGPVCDAGEMTVPIALFEMHLRHLSSNGYTVRSAEWLVEELSAGRGVPDRTVVITFDDGLADIDRLAAPALARYAYPYAVFLLVAALTGRTNEVRHAWPHGYLTAEQARSLIHSPHVTFGCHGDTHEPLAGLTETAVRADAAGAKERLQDLLGREIRLFAYPFGVREMWSAIPRHAVAAAGFTAGFTSVFGTNDAGTDVFRIRRTRISWRDGPDRFARILSGCYDWYAGVQRMQVVAADLLGVIPGGL
jgi:peptidoglycan/xylan/chitin deacetylase (PgdA/CDA1 family)